MATAGQMRPAAHITTSKYRRNRAFEANLCWAAGGRAEPRPQCRHCRWVVGQFEQNCLAGAKALNHFIALTAPFDFAQGGLEVVPFHDRFKLAHYLPPLPAPSSLILTS